MKEHELSFGVYIVVWLFLIVLTLTTVTVAGLHLGALSVGVALLIASIKGTLVLLYFMHLKFEDPVFKIMLFVALGTIVIILVLTFADVLFRGVL